jgi:hypothetical protein
LATPVAVSVTCKYRPGTSASWKLPSPLSLTIFFAVSGFEPS